jgi:hypothetical protein
MRFEHIRVQPGAERAAEPENLLELDHVQGVIPHERVGNVERHAAGDLRVMQQGAIS